MSINSTSRSNIFGAAAIRSAFAFISSYSMLLLSSAQTSAMQLQDCVVISLLRAVHSLATHGPGVCLVFIPISL